MASNMLHYVVEFDDGSRFSVHIDPDDPTNLKIDGAGANLQVAAGSQGLLVSTDAQQRVPLSLRYEQGELIAETADGVRRRARVELAGASEWRKAVSDLPPPPPPVHSGRIEAPIAGHIVALLVVEGTQVQLGTPIFVLEAMKMQNTLLAPVAGAIHYKIAAGQIVRSGDLIAIIGELGE